MFSLVLPFHSDIRQLKKTLKFLKTSAKEKRINQILLCHNGSPLKAELEEEVKKNSWEDVSLLHTDEMGIGAGYKIGIQAAREEFVVLSASDLPFGFTDVDSFCAYEKEYGKFPDIGMGSKAHKNSRIAGLELKRKMVSRGFWMLRVLALGRDTPKDSQGSLIIKTHIARDIINNSQHNNYFFSVELISLAQKAGHVAVELPVILINRNLESSVSLFKDSLQMGKDLIVFSRRLRREK